MDTGLKNKYIFITGGAHGIGKAIVKAFCKEGAIVTFCDIDKDAGVELSEELACSFIKVDVLNKEELTLALESTISNNNALDILINNVGISHFKSILDISITEFEQILSINLLSAFITSQIFAKFRSKQEINKYGRIINIASTRYLMSEAGTEAYSASKGGIVSLTHALSISLAPYNSQVNCISPGWIETGNYSLLKESDHLQHPSGRVGKPSDIARMCLFLAMPENDFINGQNFIIDGGMTKKMIYKD